MLDLSPLFYCLSKVYIWEAKGRIGQATKTVVFLIMLLFINVFCKKGVNLECIHALFLLMFYPIISKLRTCHFIQLSIKY